MLTQLQLEGPELEPLLARVRTELGAHARIVHAEKIRSGGVAGFFAHQRFELTVEVDTAVPRTPASAVAASSAAAPAPSTITMPPAPALSAGPAAAAAAAAPATAPPAAAVPAAAEADPARASAATAAPAPAGFSAIAGLEPAGAFDEPSLYTGLPSASVPAASVPSRFLPTAPAQDGVHTPAPARAAASVYAPQAATAPAPELPSGLGAALSQDEQMHEPQPGRPLTVPSAVTAPAAGTASPAAEPPAGAAVPGELVSPSTAFAPHAAFASLVDDAPGPAAPPSAPSVLDLADRISAEEQAALVSTESPSFASLLTRLGHDLGADPIVPPVATPPVATPPVATPPVATPPVATPATGALLTAPAPAATATQGPPAEPGPARSVPAQRPATADRSAQESAAADRSAEESATADLARLGLPAHLRPAGFGQQLHTALRASLTRLPTAPPAINRPGGVLAVVGPLAIAVQVAREVAEELGLPLTTSVAVATSERSVTDVPERQVLRGTAEAVERRTAWRRRNNLTVVAVEAPLTATGAADARAFLTALSPTTTWGAVEATRKAQDVGAWTRALGGVHALALTDLEETADPAAVLELGIPVSRLGGRPATPRAWATLLTGRLAA